MTSNEPSSQEWSTFPSNTESQGIKAWHNHQVPYKDDANALQNLEIWIPNASNSTDPSPPPSPSSKGTWIVYIHGGAWRDPLVDSTSFNTTVEKLLANHASALTNVAGLASINYSLSPHPNHPTHPAPVPDPESPNKAIPSRSAKHPDHIIDVLTALSYLHTTFNMKIYILSGHSCGATLALQVAFPPTSAPWLSSLSAPSPPAPAVIIGLNGLYDMPTLIAHPGERHIGIKMIYVSFMQLAFGTDETVWKSICPAYVDDWSSSSTSSSTTAADNGEEQKLKVILAQSHDDSLVPYSQTEIMLEKLRGQKGAVVVDEMEVSGGDHNELWAKGDRLAEILVGGLDMLSSSS